MKRTILTTITSLFAIAALTPTTAEAWQLRCRRIGAGGPVTCKLTFPPPTCTPCVNGCDAHDNCLGEPYGGPEWPLGADDACKARLVPAGEPVKLADQSPFIMAGNAWVGACSDGYAWLGEGGLCQDTDGAVWPCEPAFAAVSAVTLSADSECFGVEADGVSALVCGADISVCTGEGCIDWQETREGCQYYGPEGPDDIAVCVLTVADEACNGCISGEPWR